MRTLSVLIPLHTPDAEGKLCDPNCPFRRVLPAGGLVCRLQASGDRTLQWNTGVPVGSLRSAACLAMETKS